MISINRPSILNVRSNEKTPTVPIEQEFDGILLSCLYCETSGQSKIRDQCVTYSN